MPRERKKGFSDVSRLFQQSGDSLDGTQAAIVGNCSKPTANRWLAQLKHRATVFNQAPIFDENGRFVQWGTTASQQKEVI